MSTFKIVTGDFGIVEVKARKKFEHIGEVWAVAESPYKYLNSAKTSYITRCFHVPTGYSLPINYIQRETLKNFVLKSKTMIDGFVKTHGLEETRNEIYKHEVINK